MRLVLAFVLLAVAARPQTKVMLEGQIQGPVLAAPALCAYAPPGSVPGLSILTPIRGLDGLSLGSDMILRVTSQPAPVQPPVRIFAVRQPDGTWVANSARITPLSTYSLRRNGLENYAVLPNGTSDFAITLSNGLALIKPVQPWDSSNVVALWVW